VIYITDIGEKQTKIQPDETILLKPRNDPETHGA
jgi:hypothetical protein